MAITYTYKGVEGNYHVWERFDKIELSKYTRHIKDEEVREQVIEKYRSLGFTEKMIELVLGSEMMYGAQDFSTRDVV